MNYVDCNNELPLRQLIASGCKAEPAAKPAPSNNELPLRQLIARALCCYLIILDAVIILLILNIIK